MPSQFLRRAGRLPLHAARDRRYLYLFAWFPAQGHLPGLASEVACAQFPREKSEVPTRVLDRPGFRGITIRGLSLATLALDLSAGASDIPLPVPELSRRS